MTRLVERDYVANRGDTRDVRLEAIVHVHVPTFEPKPGFRGAKAVGDRPAPGRDEQILRSEPDRRSVRRLRFNVHASGARARVGDLRAGVDLDALLLERLLELGGDGFVLERHEAGKELDDRDLAAEAAEYRRELDADGAAAQNNDR